MKQLEKDLNYVPFLGKVYAPSTPMNRALRASFGLGKARSRRLMELAGFSNRGVPVLTTVKDLHKVEKIIEKAYVTDRFLKIRILQKLEELRKGATYRGLRHRQNLPVRGQRTHSNGSS